VRRGDGENGRSLTMTKAKRWAWIISLVAITGAVLVLSFLLSIATNNRALYERHYAWLFWVNVAVAGFLVLVIGLAGVRLTLRLREQLSAQDIAIVGAGGQIILSAGSGASSLLPDRPSAILLRNARTTRVVSQLEGLEDDATAGTARIRALAYIPNTNFVLAQQ